MKNSHKVLIAAVVSVVIGGLMIDIGLVAFGATLIVLGTLGIIVAPVIPGIDD